MTMHALFEDPSFEVTLDVVLLQPSYDRLDTIEFGFEIVRA
jgi:hypothetical protein